MASFLFEAFNSTLYLYLDMMTSTTRLRDPAFKELCARNKSRARTVVKVLVRPLIIIGSIMPVCCLLADDALAGWGGPAGWLTRRSGKPAGWQARWLADPLALYEAWLAGPLSCRGCWAARWLAG